MKSVCNSENILINWCIVFHTVYYSVIYMCMMTPNIMKSHYHLQCAVRPARFHLSAIHAYKIYSLLATQL